MEPRIKDGDLIIVKKTPTADSGEVVVCVNNGEAMIKMLQKEDRRIFLVSLNNKYAPFTADEDDFHIEGAVRAIMSHSLIA